MMFNKRYAFLCFFFLILFFAAYADVPNGLVKISAEPIDEGETLDVLVYCKQSNTDIVTVALYGPDDHVMSSIDISCNQASQSSVTFTNLKAGIYKVKATMGPNFEPAMMFTYVNVRPSVISILSLPEQPLPFVLVIGFSLIFLLRCCKHKER